MSALLEMLVLAHFRLLDCLETVVAAVIERLGVQDALRILDESVTNDALLLVLGMLTHVRGMSHKWG